MNWYTKVAAQRDAARLNEEVIAAVSTVCGGQWNKVFEHTDTHPANYPKQSSGRLCLIGNNVRLQGDQYYVLIQIHLQWSANPPQGYSTYNPPPKEKFEQYDSHTGSPLLSFYVIVNGWKPGMGSPELDDPMGMHEIGSTLNDLGAKRGIPWHVHRVQMRPTLDRMQRMGDMEDVKTPGELASFVRKCIFEENDEREPEVAPSPVQSPQLVHAKVAGTAYPNPLRFIDECVGSHHGQTDMRLQAIDTVTNKLVGYIEYAVFGDEVHIAMIEAEPKRQYIGTQLFNQLKIENPGKAIMRSNATPDGSAFRNAIDPVKKLAPQQVIQAAVKAREEYGIRTGEQARFGDCRYAAEETAKLIQRMGGAAQMAHGQFLANPADDEEWDHSWVVVDGQILDPTIDQFFSSLDVDLETATPGVYYSHPQHDGSKYVQRYRPTSR
jgi:hypothetical protein